jgi:hypothetical protein
VPSVGSVTCVKCHLVSSAVCLYQQGVFPGLLRRSDPVFSSLVIRFFTKLVVSFEVYINITHVCNLASTAFQISYQCALGSWWMKMLHNQIKSMTIITIAITTLSSQRRHHRVCACAARLPHVLYPLATPPTPGFPPNFGLETPTGAERETRRGGGVSPHGIAPGEFETSLGIRSSTPPFTTG